MTDNNNNNNNNNNINNNNNNDRLFYLIFKNKILKNIILNKLKLLNKYYQQREINVNIKYSELEEWLNHPHIEYFNSIKISFINNNFDNTIKFIKSLPKNIKSIQLDRLFGLSDYEFQVLSDTCNGLIKTITIPYNNNNQDKNNFILPSSVEYCKANFDLKSLNSTTIGRSIFPTNSCLKVLDLRSTYYSIPIEDFKYLPNSLKILYLNNRFNLPIPPSTLPSNLKKIKFGSKFNQPIYNLSILPSGLESVEFSINYNQQFDFQFFPKSIKKLKILTIGFSIKKFKNEHLLSNLKLLNIGDSFNHSFKIPTKLEKLSIGIDDRKTLKSIANLKSLKKLYLENDSAKMFFGKDNNKRISALKYFPASLKSLKLKSNTELSFEELPKSINKIKIKYNNIYEKEINQIKLPPTVHTLKLMISQVITSALLSRNTNLKRLKFSNAFCFEIQRYSLPPSLKSVEFGESFKLPFIESCLPPGLKYLKIGNLFINQLNKDYLPQNLQILEIGRNYLSSDIILDQLQKSLKIIIIQGETKLITNSNTNTDTDPERETNTSTSNLESIYIDSLNKSILSNLNLSLQLLDLLKPISTLQINKIYSKLIKQNINKI